VSERFDAVVVGAGPAGSMAALALARAGRSVCLLERGPFPGSKNLFGGVVYPRVLDEVLPRWADEAPIERFVTRRVTMVLTPTQSAALDFRSSAWGERPYNGATVLRPRFDSWLAGEAESAGATLVCSTTATGLMRDGSGRVTGVRTDRPRGEMAASVVIACDGVNSFLAREAGLARKVDPSHYTLGVKEVLAVGEGEIERRFSLGPGEGADLEVLGETGGVPGGGFVYTNRETVSVGLVLSVPALGKAGRRPEDLLRGFKQHPAISPLVAGGEVVEYGAHLIPEAGVAMMPRLAGAGMLVAGDAAGMCLAAGIWLEGVNFAMAAGLAAGETAAEAIGRSDTSAAGLSGYERRLGESFVLADLRRLEAAPRLLLSERMQVRYPAVVCNLLEAMFTVRNPSPKEGAVSLLRRELRRGGVRLRDAGRDGWRIWRTFG
jgi:electron transfer flavoprotein-quinone oxidoreductase